MDRFEHAGKAFERLCRIMAELRAPGGCPWDREQTLASLKPYLIEEAYETLEAIERGDPAAHREELGDLLLQVVFQAEVTHEQGSFTAAEVAEGIHDKLVRRHPHVFGEVRAADAAGALKSWEAIKASEKAGRGRLAGVPKNLPALLRATRTGEKAAGIGFDWPSVEGVREKVEEEWKELMAALASSSPTVAEELGDVLFALANMARKLGIDAEAALRQATDKFARRFEHVERRVAERGGGRVPLEELEKFWEEAKAAEKFWASDQG